MMEGEIPNPSEIYATKYKTSVFLKNIVKAPNTIVGDYTYYDDDEHPLEFEKRNALFNYPFLHDRLIIGKFVQIAKGATFIMNAANHRLNTATTYPFNVLGGLWEEISTPHIEDLPNKGDIVVGNDVWIGHNAVIMPGVKIGDGAIVGAYAIVAKNVEPYSVVVGNPAHFVKYRFHESLRKKLLELKWWDFDSQTIIELIPLLTSNNLVEVEQQIDLLLKKR